MFNCRINRRCGLVKGGFFFSMCSVLLFSGCTRKIEESDVVGQYKVYPHNAGYRQFAIYSNGLYRCEYFHEGGWVIKTNSWRLDIAGRSDGADASLLLCGFHSIGTSSVAVSLKWSGGIQILMDGRGTICERCCDISEP